MALTDEDKAFLIKIGQIDKTPTPAPTKEKDKE
jgi:hypothetical protein